MNTFLLIKIGAIAFFYTCVKSDCPPNLKLLCYEQNTCLDCIRAHSCCNWCYDEENFTGTHRCSFLEDLTECKPKIEKNKDSSINVIQDNSFTLIKSVKDASTAIQIKPQAFKVALRKDTPVNLTFTYKAAKNYPLELYYLGDLSYSMRDHLETLKNLGDDLSKSLSKLTENYRLAYGSFLDKPAMPFIYTDQANLKNPCFRDRQCEKTYLFKHKLDFTNDVDKFFEEVKRSNISANLDDLDGALEAIFQILVCNERFGWSNYSRKIILLSTDSFLHSAGDGILAGASQVNNLCLVNEEGEYVNPLKFDYPSLGQIKDQLNKFKANLIVAVTQEKLQYYKRMEKDILEKEAFVGELQENSKNILELVRTGFYDFMRQVEFSADVSGAPELDVKFFGDCHKVEQFNDTSGCQNVEEEKELKFIIQLTLKEFTHKTHERIIIKENKINEDITVDIEYIVGQCNCPYYDNSSQLTSCKHGTFSCGVCSCETGWAGEDCSEECVNKPGACKLDEDSLTCSGSGECICSKCECAQPYTGKFCQFECPTDNRGRVCSGLGQCYEGVCQCNTGYEGNDCSCQTSTDYCKLKESDTDLCSGHGICKCNKCLCAEEFQGTFCEQNSTYNILCEVYNDYVKNHTEQNIFEFENVTVNQYFEGERCDSECLLVLFPNDAERCTLSYCINRGETIHLAVKEKNCWFTQAASALFLGLITFLVIFGTGLFFIFWKKYQVHKADKAEYKRFKDETKNTTEMNPIYRSPVSNFENPMARNARPFNSGE